ncbi:reverse transcriptase-rnase h-integrase [Moniliophthora roreri]|nr:reverse transcriptase-rnase h-integrase [Moniliophthora roreri]
MIMDCSWSRGDKGRQVFPNLSLLYSFLMNFPQIMCVAGGPGGKTGLPTCQSLMYSDIASNGKKSRLVNMLTLDRSLHLLAAVRESARTSKSLHSCTSPAGSTSRKFPPETHGVVLDLEAIRGSVPWSLSEYEGKAVTNAQAFTGTLGSRRMLGRRRSNL